ncbi:DUF58 domain-containing protein [Rhodococcus sp. NPDC058514]|uniref:DUF58 domain-containing protein n=1 Tax=unclassified Rhodococcus (in: high G+C Gram-positive bacteria) TaxID=192944 RepID=UPI0036662197
MSTLDWRASPAAAALATCSATALVVALAVGRPELLVFAAPMLGALAARAVLPRPVEGVAVHGAPETVRLFEGESVRLAVAADPAGRPQDCVVRPIPQEGLEFGPIGEGPDAAHLGLSITARRWGSYRPRVAVTATAAGGLLTGAAVAEVARIDVFPLVDPTQPGIPRTNLPDRFGAHPTDRHGPGVEYADIRAYVPGDQLRAVNWPVSARRRALHVTERRTDRAADVVVLIDAHPQAPGPASESLDRSVRGGCQVAQAALRRGDRTSVVVLGDGSRWLGPDLGRRQFYRIVEAVLGAGERALPLEGTLVPRPAVPPGAVVIAFSTLLDTDFALSLLDLRRRGRAVVVVDVLVGPPFGDKLDPTVARMWRLERRNMYRDLGVLGVDVVEWQEDSSLERVLAGLGLRGRRAVVRP